MAGAGDVNNDGYDDILIGAYGDNDGGVDAGQTYLIFGNTSDQFSMDMDLSNADASFIGEDNFDWSGYSVAGAGDVNNDGYDDILIGAWGDEDGGSGAGQTYLIFGWGTPPGSFSLNTNTTLPDTDGMFWLNWSESVGADNYSIYWSTSPDVDDGNTRYVDNLVNDTMLINSFTSGTYYFRMVSYNNIGSTWSNELLINIELPPGAFELDTNITLPDTDGMFWLNWSESIGADNYSIYWSTSPNVDDGDTLYVDDLVNGTMFINGFLSGTYYFRMVSYNNTGSTWSNELLITVQFPSVSDDGDDDDDSSSDSEAAIPFGNYYVLYLLLGVLSLIIISKRKVIKNQN